MAIGTTPAVALGFGGNIAAHYNFGSLTESTNGDGLESIDNDTYSGFDVQGSVGFALGGRVGVQLDAGWMSFDSPSYDYHTSTAYNLHVFMPVGNMQLGAFYGFGVGDHEYEGDTGDVTYYGVDLAMPLGSGQLAAQVGFANHDNTHSSLDYTGALFGAVAYSHFVNDNLMLRGTAGMANFVTHDEPGAVYLLQAEASYALSRNLAANIGVRDIIISNAGEGSGNDLAFFAGIQVFFGGGGIRESMASTPMIATMLPSLAATASSIVD